MVFGRTGRPSNNQQIGHTMLTTVSAATAAAAAVAHWGGPWAGGFGFLFLLIPLFWIGVIVLIIALVGRRRRAYWHQWGPGPQGHASSSAEATLAERFAQGDIDEVEYRKRLEVLRANRPSQP
jgi:Predicted membrane protein